MHTDYLKAPFPYFGGKGPIASLVWDYLGDVKNYVEPFAGSLAVLLRRPTEPKIETVNDLDGFVVNFWRAVAAAPLEVAQWANWPVTELDLHARNAWLIERSEPLAEQLRNDPDYYDTKVAGWWAWGASAWIGSGWGKRKKQQLPHLGHTGRGVHRIGVESLEPWMETLAARLRRVRVACGDWKRVMGPAVTYVLGLTGVFLDPPYAAERYRVYNHDSYNVAKEVNAWCVENGDNPLLRIVLAGYEGEHNNLEALGWRKVEWKAHGGYAHLGDAQGKKNKHLERLWISPHCEVPGLGLFERSNA